MKKGKEVLSRIQKDIKEYGWAVAAFLVCYLLIHKIFGAFCPMVVVTGIPCAACGLTRAVLCIFTAQFEEAFAMQPFAFLVLGFLLYCGVFRYLLRRRIKGLKLLTGLLIAGMTVFYCWQMWKYFPGREPYVYHEHNILGVLFPPYKRWIEGLLY